MSFWPRIARSLHIRVIRGSKNFSNFATAEDTLRYAQQASEREDVSLLPLYSRRCRAVPLDVATGRLVAGADAECSRNGEPGTIETKAMT